MPIILPLRLFAMMATLSFLVSWQINHVVGSEELPVASSLIATTEIARSPVDDSLVSGCVTCRDSQDRIYLVSTRHITYDVCRAPLSQVPFRMWVIEQGTCQPISLDEYQLGLTTDRPVVIYVHGNRMSSEDILTRASHVRHIIRSRCSVGPIDWVIFSWPAQKEAIGIRDFREKAKRTDAQGLYLASFLRHHVQASVPLALIGYSFGARVTTGALHALAGGGLAGRRLPDEPVQGAHVSVGLVAPAIESSWLGCRGYHRHATKNMERLVLLYNRRDVVLKRYWLLEKVRRGTALGYSGPSYFAPRADGTRLPIRSRDCSPSVKIRHAELDYYDSGCNAGCDMARMINELTVRTD